MQLNIKQTYNITMQSYGSDIPASYFDVACEIPQHCMPCNIKSN